MAGLTAPSRVSVPVDGGHGSSHVDEDGRRSRSTAMARLGQPGACQKDYRDATLWR